MDCPYKCIFGILDRPEGLPENSAFRASHKNRSYLCQTDRAGNFFFFAFSKRKDDAAVSGSKQRYTSDDEKEAVAQYGNDAILPGLRFKDIYARRRLATLVPVQEYVLETCFYKRAILIGDSFHKVGHLLWLVCGYHT